MERLLSWLILTIVIIVLFYMSANLFNTEVSLTDNKAYRSARTTFNKTIANQKEENSKLEVWLDENIVNLK